jgi:hypothetical protein
MRDHWSEVNFRVGHTSGSRRFTLRSQKVYLIYLSLNVFPSKRIGAAINRIFECPVRIHDQRRYGL